MGSHMKIKPESKHKIIILKCIKLKKYKENKIKLHHLPI